MVAHGEGPSEVATEVAENGDGSFDVRHAAGPMPPATVSSCFQKDFVPLLSLQP